MKVSPKHSPFVARSECKERRTKLLFNGHPDEPVGLAKKNNLTFPFGYPDNATF